MGTTPTTRGFDADATVKKRETDERIYDGSHRGTTERGRRRRTRCVDGARDANVATNVSRAISRARIPNPIQRARTAFVRSVGRVSVRFAVRVVDSMRSDDRERDRTKTTRMSVARTPTPTPTSWTSRMNRGRRVRRTTRRTTPRVW